MPVYNTRDLIPFVNELEQRLMETNDGLETWFSERGTILNRTQQIPANTNRSTLALVRADEAMAEIGSATYGIAAQRGNRLKELIESLKREMVEIAENTEGVGGGYDPRINAEIDNAIADVDSVIEDGLKLDYRLREMQKSALEGGAIASKELILPYTIEMGEITTKEIQLEEIENIVFVDGRVTVLNLENQPIQHRNGEIIYGTINEEGILNLNYLPLEPVKVYFPAQMALKDVPKDVVSYLIETLLEKNGQYMQDLLLIKEDQERITADIQAMKGQNWTFDFSIMRNHRAIVQEAITPKGIQTEVIDGMAYVTFSYNDHPNISHWELYKWDEEENDFVPHDGKQGILPK